MANLPTATRRGFLGAMTALPLVGAVAMPASATPPSPHAWNANLARYLRLDAASLDGLPEADQEAIMDDCSDALTGLLQTPAPDQSAVADKLEIYIREFGDITTRGHLSDAIADLRRLAVDGR